MLSSVECAVHKGAVEGVSPLIQCRVIEVEYCCNRQTLATKRVIIGGYPKVLCVVLGWGNSNAASINLAVRYPVLGLQLSQIFGSHQGTVDLQYNLVATVNRKTNRQQGHYMAVGQLPRSNYWYTYDTTVVKRERFMNRKTNYMMAHFQRTAPILVYVNNSAVSVQSNNLHTDDGDIGQQTPTIVHVQDDKSTLSSNSDDQLSTE